MSYHIKSYHIISYHVVLNLHFCIYGSGCVYIIILHHGIDTTNILFAKLFPSLLGYKCGDVAYYCPLGSSYPRAVQSGYYSSGGGKLSILRECLGVVIYTPSFLFLSEVKCLHTFLILLLFQLIIDKQSDLSILLYHTILY